MGKAKKKPKDLSREHSDDSSENGTKDMSGNRCYSDDESSVEQKGAAKELPPDAGDNPPSLDNGDTKAAKRRKVHRLSLKKTEDYNEKLKKRGVVYIARIPPRMTPTKLKNLLQDFNVTRIYLVEEDPSVRKRRRKLTGNASKRYTEGWIEFESKKVAKHVARSLNNTQMSNHKRSHHYDDLWNLKYLSKFQWSHLTEKVAYERRVREQKLRLETMQAKRETAAYKQLVEKGQTIDRIQERKRKRAEREGKQPEIKKSRIPERQVKPVQEGSKATKKALLGALV